MTADDRHGGYPRPKAGGGRSVPRRPVKVEDGGPKGQVATPGRRPFRTAEPRDPEAATGRKAAGPQAAVAAGADGAGGKQAAARPRPRPKPRPSATRPATGPTRSLPGSRDAARPTLPRPPAVGPAPRRPRGSALRGARIAYEKARKAWDRPLTAYYVILGSSLLITVLGLVMVFSASQIKALQNDLPSTYFFRKQLIAAAIGTVLLALGARLPVRTHRAFAYPLLLGTAFLLCLVQIPGIGVSINGNQNWIALGGPFMLQPSEFGKLALILFGADLLTRKGEKNLLVQWKHLLVPLVPAALLILGLVLLGGDMGTAIVLSAILFGLLWLAGAPTRLFVGVLGSAAAVGVLLIETNPNRLDRFSCVGSMDPTKCWQAVHGIYALSSGGWFGSGLGASVEKWGQLPEPHTDFIFAVTGEELGLAGTLSVLALFAALGYAGIRVAGRTEDPFVRYAAGGVTTWITAQAVVNIGAVLGLLPIAGVPLPLFSYGGSALLPTMFAIGLLICFARSEPAARAALATRKRNSLMGAVTRTMRRFVKRRPSGER